MLIQNPFQDWPSKVYLTLQYSRDGLFLSPAENKSDRRFCGDSLIPRRLHATLYSRGFAWKWVQGTNTQFGYTVTYGLLFLRQGILETIASTSLYKTQEYPPPPLCHRMLYTVYGIYTSPSPPPPPTHTHTHQIPQHCMWCILFYMVHMAYTDHRPLELAPLPYIWRELVTHLQFVCARG